ncbi:MAG TPA: RNA-binding protein [Clostridiales bacterium]|nr:RNA-binding protein [Clostridiales bacterium]
MKDQTDKLVLAKINDDINKVLMDYKAVGTSFFDPVASKAVEQFLSGFNDVKYYKYGGHEHAERTVFVIYPFYMDKPDCPFIKALRILWNPKYHRIDHRDILGSLIGSGIKREKIGDIIVESGMAHVFISSELAPYVENNLLRIGKAAVSVQAVSCEEAVVSNPKTKIIRTTVASPRLDSIISACFGLSRTKALPLITNGKVRVNWDLVQKPDFLVSPGDMLSVRDMGRGKVSEFHGTTKKDRLLVVLEKYI